MCARVRIRSDRARRSLGTDLQPAPDHYPGSVFAGAKVGRYGQAGVAKRCGWGRKAAAIDRFRCSTATAPLPEVSVSLNPGVYPHISVIRSSWRHFDVVRLCGRSCSRAGCPFHAATMPRIHIHHGRRERHSARKRCGSERGVEAACPQIVSCPRAMDATVSVDSEPRLLRVRRALSDGGAGQMAALAQPRSKACSSLRPRADVRFGAW